MLTLLLRDWSELFSYLSSFLPLLLLDRLFLLLFLFFDLDLDLKHLPNRSAKEGAIRVSLVGLVLLKLMRPVLLTCLFISPRLMLTVLLKELGAEFE